MNMKIYISHENERLHGETWPREIAAQAIRKCERKTQAARALLVTPAETWLTVYRRRLIMSNKFPVVVGAHSVMLRGTPACTFDIVNFRGH